MNTELVKVIAVIRSPIFSDEQIHYTVQPRSKYTLASVKIARLASLVLANARVESATLASIEASPRELISGPRLQLAMKVDHVNVR